VVTLFLCWHKRLALKRWPTVWDHKHRPHTVSSKILEMRRGWTTRTMWVLALITKIYKDSWQGTRCWVECFHAGPSSHKKLTRQYSSLANHNEDNWQNVQMQNEIKPKKKLVGLDKAIEFTFQWRKKKGCQS